ncbi:MAG: Dyp-type peroxidase [Moraxella sp.]|nr:Dyp-type peroxidase [Moraxella sp.]
MTANTTADTATPNKHTPQSAIMPEHCTAGIFIEADIINATDTSVQQAIGTACRQALQILHELQTAYPESLLGLTIGFGAGFWHSVANGEGQQLMDFVPLGGGLAPATQHDMMLHIQSMRHELNFALAQQVLAAFGDRLGNISETHGFRHLGERGWDGFVDGTENPHDDNIAPTAIINTGVDAGGSYVLLQKYHHDLAKWQGYSLDEQEESVARTKADNVEFDKSRRHPRSHIARTNLKEDGVGLKIVRRSLPYGTVSGEHGLMFIAYAARLHNIHAQLVSMFGDTDGQTDLLLERLSTAVSGAYYFAPSQERLAAL